MLTLWALIFFLKLLSPCRTHHNRTSSALMTVSEPLNISHKVYECGYLMDWFNHQPYRSLYIQSLVPSVQVTAWKSVAKVHRLQYMHRSDLYLWCTGIKLRAHIWLCGDLFTYLPTYASDLRRMRRRRCVMYIWNTCSIAKLTSAGLYYIGSMARFSLVLARTYNWCLSIYVARASPYVLSDRSSILRTEVFIYFLSGRSLDNSACSLTASYFSENT